jgi:hypothetical protein
MNALAIGERVILRSFNGTAIPPQDCKPGENYWLLIGSAGKIVSHRSDGQRMVVEFETSVHSFGKRPAIPPWLGIGVGCR